MEEQKVNKRIKWISSSLIIAGIVWLLYQMGQWIVPFVIAFILAYAFHVPSKKLEKILHISATLSSIIIVLGLIAFVSLFTVFLAPLLKNATMIIIQKLPIIIRELPAHINENLHSLFAILGIDRSFDTGAIFNEYLSKFALNLPKHIFGFIDTGMTLMYVVMFAFMTPIITFYLLKDWEKVENSFVSLLNKCASPSVISVLHPINAKLGAYGKGQLIVCLILAFAYSLGLLFIGVERYIVCGIISGMLAVAPFFGAIIGLVTTLATSLDCLHSYQYIMVVALYLVIPFIDSNFITPRLIGKSTGIQPVWLLFSICACLSILGTVGIFISVPMAVILSTVCKECVKKL